MQSMGLAQWEQLAHAVTAHKAATAGLRLGNAGRERGSPARAISCCPGIFPAA